MDEITVTFEKLLKDEKVVSWLRRSINKLNKRCVKGHFS